ncbi:hypothetical protein Nepgr_011438 [Nepenthes gracilis]|uniref:Uncharacterized protein n=1 Tax=Nepenthes gracilis TaxID=150966 RepID=A0AAD3XLZ2_NEPGR|nr:hypothetical protein Nepgr_011438 [Nepenthes gracilis]
MKSAPSSQITTYVTFSSTLPTKSSNFPRGETITGAYAAAEEANEAKRPERADQPRPFPSDGKRKYNGGEHSRQKQRRTGLPERGDYRPTTFTPMHTRSNVRADPRRKIFEVAKGAEEGLLNRLSIRLPLCRPFDQDRKAPQKEIEDLIRRGHLTRFVKGPGKTQSGQEEGQERLRLLNRLRRGGHDQRPTAQGPG